ncbi:hypothetical protein ACH5RR_023232 [Cinchona calisaya]|uniref:Uncharacterized protein n=1 Tax=Cinchona calisaya TaxID=153742 RepID=A0ABD2ZDI8_9GENT
MGIIIEELRPVVFSLDAHSAPGQDGFSSLFFVKCWDIIKEDIMAVATYFFLGHSLPKSFDATQIVLIPKRQNPITFSDFRPTTLRTICKASCQQVTTNHGKDYIQGAYYIHQRKGHWI